MDIQYHFFVSSSISLTLFSFKLPFLTWVFTFQFKSDVKKVVFQQFDAFTLKLSY
jgi:hypothetical protein